MNPQGLHSIAEIVLHASPVVQAALLLLMFASLYTWALIFAKWRALRRIRAQDEAFLQIYHAGKPTTEVLKEAQVLVRSPLAAAFVEAQRAYAKAQQLRDARAAMDAIRQAAAHAAEARLNAEAEGLVWLAIVASASPFVGLFGTVWGIMHTFRDIGAMRTATLATVAPGIAEALVATALGLFAAIPAVVAYNRFSAAFARRAQAAEGFAAQVALLFAKGL